MTKPEAKHELMAHWAQAWTTLGRWQALNARLSKEIAPRNTVWRQRSSRIFVTRAVPAGVSVMR